MRLADVKLSNPFVFYDVTVSHFASRKATAIEWVILEAIQAASSSAEYRDVPFSAVFEEIFSIKEADRLIKPVIYDLVGFGMISVEGLSDEVSLSRMSMNQFALTDKGEKLRKDGVLPGKTMEDVVQVVINAASGKLSSVSRKGLSPEPTGIKRAAIDTADDIVFPSAEVKEYLDQARVKGTISWLGKDAQVQDLDVQSSELLWKNTAAHLDVGRGLECCLSGEADPELNALALMATPLEHDDREPMVSMSNPDEESLWFDGSADLSARIIDSLPDDGFAVVSKQAFKSAGDRKIVERIKSGAILVTGCENTSVEVLGKTVIVSVPEAILRQGMLLASERCCVSRGNFKLSSGSQSRLATLMYATKGFDVIPHFEEAARKHSADNILAVLPLISRGREEAFLEIASGAVTAADTVDDKVARISELNEAAKRLGLDGLPPDVSRTLLLKDLDSIFSGMDLASIPDAIADEVGEASMRADEGLRLEVIGLAAESAEPPTDISKVWGFWQSLEGHGWSFEGIRDSPSIRNIYTDDCLRQILMVFDSDEFYSMPAYTVVERSVLQLRRASDSLAHLIADADFSKPLTVEDARRLCVANKSSLGEIYSELRAWKSKIEDLCNVGIGEQALMYDDLPFHNIALSIESLIQGIEPFYDEGMLKYDKVYVADTCAIMNEPSIISEFESEWAMLIITRTTLEELDGLKTSDDEDRALKARDAIREIDNHRAYDWLNLKENSYPELLDEESDKGRNDNRILSVALKYIIKAPVLITDDVNLRNISETYSVESITSKEFLENRRQARVKPKRTAKGKKKKR